MYEAMYIRRTLITDDGISTIPAINQRPKLLFYRRPKVFRPKDKLERRGGPNLKPD
jgi:hypothetical protein